MSNIKLNYLIALRQRYPEYKLVEGQIGCIREIFGPDEFEVEFSDENAHTIATLRLNLQKVRLLHEEATLTEQDFWKLIQEAKAASNDNGERQVEILVDQLAQRSIPDIFEFKSIFDKFHDMAYRSDLWAAATIINGWCSNDGFMDFRAWLIAQGETIFHEALHNPDSLVDIIEGEEDEFGRLGYAFLESMNYVAWRAYKKKTGQERPLFRGVHVPPKLTGEKWDDEDTIRELYPKLAAKFH